MLDRAHHRITGRSTKEVLDAHGVKEEPAF
jgi:hypothetical protein